MPIRKFTTQKLAENDTAAFAADLPFEGTKVLDWGFTPEPGYLYVTTRAISSRVNSNYDGWAPDELRKSYSSFIGRPVYVDHNNWDINRARGVIVDARINEAKLASGHEDVWVEILIEVDANAFPKLAKAILSRDIDAVSMGADIEKSICSICKNAARTSLDYCAHIPTLKGRFIESKTASGQRIRKLCYEECIGVNFFEISFVFDPADESALISDVHLAGASKAASRNVSRMRFANESVDAYQERIGFAKVAKKEKVSSEVCATCGFKGIHKHADKALMTVPAPVDTLRDAVDCPRCGSEWDGMVCGVCGFEQPPEGLGDPNTDPFGMSIPMGGQGDEEDESDESSDEDSSVSDEEGDEEEDSKGKSTKKEKKAQKEVMRVSKYDDLRKQAVLAEPPTYRQDTSPAQDAGGQPMSVEPALELGQAAPAMVQDLDGPDVQGPVGQSGVYVVNQVPGPTDVPPPGSQVGMALMEQAAQMAGQQVAARTAAYPERQETTYVTDVRNLDEPPMVNLGPDATLDVMAPTVAPEQLGLAGTPGTINDGSETGLPSVRERLPQQFNPFNDAAVRPAGSVEELMAQDGAREARRAVQRKAREDQRVSAAKARILRIASFVDERLELGLTKPEQKFADIAKFEAMDDATLDGYIQATREFKATEIRSAGKRVRVANKTESAFRMPSLGSASRVASFDSEEDETANDYVAFL